MSEFFSLTYEDLRRFCPQGKSAILRGIAAHSSLLEEYGVANNDVRLAHFLAQAAHETDGFRTLTEYGSTQYFRSRYGHRRDLGNRRRSDGSRFRGRGIFQLTGRANYRRYGQFLKLDLEANPLLAGRPEHSLRIACEYWVRQNLNLQADRNDIKTITKRINGGFNGLRDRRRYFRQALSIWGKDKSKSARRPWLRFGDTGDAVVKMQQALTARGYKIEVDGLFGRRTRQALRAFQQDSHLAPDGIYGPRSQRQLRHPWWTDFLKNLFSTRLKETQMNQWKSYLQSRAIWANIIGFSALALDLFGFEGVSSQDQSTLTDQLLKLVEAGGFIAGIVFRAIARNRLGPSLF